MKSYLPLRPSGTLHIFFVCPFPRTTRCLLYPFSPPGDKHPFNTIVYGTTSHIIDAPLFVLFFSYAFISRHLIGLTIGCVKAIVEDSIDTPFLTTPPLHPLMTHSHDALSLHPLYIYRIITLSTHLLNTPSLHMYPPSHYTPRTRGIKNSPTVL